MNPIVAENKVPRKISNGQRGRSVWEWLSFSTWESIFKWATIFAGIFGAIGIGSAFTSAWVGYWVTDKVQRDADVRISDNEAKVALANKVASQAKADGESAKVVAATANQAAAEANARALEAQLALEKYKAPRILSDEQKAAMITELHGKMSEIAIVTQNDIEANAFAMQLNSVFSEMTILAPEPPGEDKWLSPAGLMMYSPLRSNEDELKDDPLYRALKAANLFGGTTSRPFLSPQLRGPAPTVIQGYNGHVLYVGQKSPF